MSKTSAWAKAKERPTEGRTIATRVRLAPSELEILDREAELQSFTNRSQYLRYLIFRGSSLPSAPPQGWKAIQALAEELGPIGRNLNQATRRLNQGGSTPPELEDVTAAVEKIRRYLAAYNMDSIKVLGRQPELPPEIKQAPKDTR